MTLNISIKIIEEDIRQEKESYADESVTLTLGKMTVLPQVIYEFHEIPIKNPT